MSEALENQRIDGLALPRRSPLEESQIRAGASMREQDGCLVAANYGDAREEYEAVRSTGAGLFDLSTRGRIEVSGREAVQFLNGMLTNDVAALKEGEWMHAAFPNPQGRLIASARVFRRGEQYLFDTEAATYARVLGALERFTLAGDFRVRDLTHETILLSVQGARAFEVVGAVLGEEASGVGRARTLTTQLQNTEVTIARATHTSEDGFDLFVNADAAVSLWDALKQASARPVGFDALEVLRVEAGIPRYLLDASETNVVLEVVDEAEAVSYTKGCYVGQEIIARIHWRGHVAKQLTGLLLDGPVETGAEARVRSSEGEGREVGRITSVVFSPHLNQQVALAQIKYDHLAAGTVVKIFDGDVELCAARVASLPFVRGSWYANVEAKR